ncbi:MAG: AAA family ATPase [Desulfofustis sp.]
MRLKLLELKAFGPFTDELLEFNSQKPGLHIIFGLNEAGKSSSLRGLKALLYGFQNRTPDNFLHSYEQLLVGGCLQNEDGRELAFQRRKRKVGDLLDAEGTPMETHGLAAFLHGVEPKIFESLYGIDHRQLVEGGDEILSQKGEVGRILFAAGAGLSSLKKVTDQLEEEAAGLFKSAGQLPEINKSIRRFNELRRELKEATLSAKDWKNLRNVLQEAESERAELEMKRAHKVKELHRLERLQQAIPELASLKIWQERLQALGTVTLLPSDFSDRYQQLEQEIREAKRQLHKNSEQLKQKEDKRQAISLPTVLLEHAELVDNFHERLGEYRKGQKDKPERNGMRINLRKEASLLLKQIKPGVPLEQVDSLRPVLAKKLTIQTLAGRFEAVSEQVRRAQKMNKAAQLAMTEADKERDDATEPMDSHLLEQAVKLARRAGELDNQIQKRRNDAEQGTEECLSELKRIGLWSGDLAALQELPLPFLETVHQFEQKFKDIFDRRQRLEKEREEDAKQLKTVQTEIKKIEYGGEIPSEEELQLTRRQRERGWQLLRRQWLDGEDVTVESQAFDETQVLPIAYEGLVKKADLLADRLRNEADRVANAATFRSRMETLQESLIDYEKVKEELDQGEQALDGAWSALWEPAGITPLTPKEMSGWLSAIEKLRFRVNELSKKEKEIVSEEARRFQLRDNLLDALTPFAVEAEVGHALGPVLILAETMLEKLDRQRAELIQIGDRQKKAREEFHRAEETLADARESLAMWRDQWAKALSGFGIEEDISPVEAQIYLDTLQSCLEKVKEADDMQKRIDGINRDADLLDREVRRLVRQVEPEILDLPLDQAIAHLRNKLAQARDDRIRLDQLGEDIDALQSETAAINKNLRDMNEHMSELLRIARCEKSEELSTVIERFSHYQQCHETISAIEARLAKIGGGATADALLEQAAGLDADELPGRIDALRQDIEKHLNPAINKISQEIGETTSQLKGMDGSAKAAETREEMEGELTRLRRLAERYLRIKLAAKILQQEIDRYREKHQGPVMKIASRYFADLTLNSFIGLKADVDDRNEPILVGILPDGILVTVEGMSDGTRDQLYLALRLATLEYRLESNEPLPFIVDDILVNFDDRRSRAALEALGELAERNQVILFTHHQAIVDQAETLGSAAEVAIHRLQV